MFIFSRLKNETKRKIRASRDKKAKIEIEKINDTVSKTSTQEPKRSEQDEERKKKERRKTYRKEEIEDDDRHETNTFSSQQLIKNRRRDVDEDQLISIKILGGCNVPSCAHS